MDANLWTQLLIAIVPALITGVGSLIIALKKCKNEINTLETNNKHEREKELSNSAMYSMMGDATKDLFTGIFNSPEFKEEMSKKIKEGFNRNN